MHALRRFTPANVLGASRRFASVDARVVQYKKHGHPSDVLSVQSVKVDDDVKDDEVFIQMLAAPISPTDLAQVRGVVSTPGGNLPKVGGNEGVGKVVKVGKGVKNLKANDVVVPGVAGFGTWRTHAVAKANDVVRVELGDYPADWAAGTMMASVVASRLLTGVEKGEWIIQSNAASTVGQAVVQLAGLKGIKTVNIVKTDPHEPDDILNHISGLNGDVVVSEDVARGYKFRTEILSDVSAPVLGLDSTGGDIGRILASVCADDARVICFGNHSRTPVQIPLLSLVDKNLTISGFNFGRWLNSASAEEKAKAFQEIIDLGRGKKLRVLMAREPFADFNAALTRALAGERKVVMNME